MTVQTTRLKVRWSGSAWVLVHFGSAVRHDRRRADDREQNRRHVIDQHLEQHLLPLQAYETRQ
jgi:hypothetical protein